MDQYFNNRQNEIFYSLLANPADAGVLYASNLQALINEFPQSGILKAMLAHAAGGEHISTAATYFNNQALFKLVNTPYDLAEVSNGQIIIQLATVNEHAAQAEADLLESEVRIEEDAEQADMLIEGSVENTEDEPHIDEDAAPVRVAETSEHEKAIQLDGPSIYPDDDVYDEIAPAGEMDIMGSTAENGTANDYSTGLSENAETTPAFEEDNKPQADSEMPEVPRAVMEDTSITESYFNEAQETSIQLEEGEQLTPVEEEEPDLVESTPDDDKIEEPYILIEDYKDDEEGSEITNEHTTAPVFVIDEREEITSLAIDDEVFDEITAIEDIRFSELIKPAAVAPEISAGSEEKTGEQVTPAHEENTAIDRALNLNDEAEKLIIGNIAATDYFVFDRALSEHKQGDTAESDAKLSEADVKDKHEEKQPPAANVHDVSKYNDEKMPYTFMWWLDKTRKEHAGLYQPYVSPQSKAVPQPRPDDLQQQYYENIFHLNSVEELDRSTSPQTIEFDMDRKEDVIIQRFIEEEPHIKPPSNDKLDNENKAKKSAEDQDELVTETLARIYTDQMLYHKAINTYKKLVLKFPEKSRYFADQIEQLQRKIN